MRKGPQGWTGDPYVICDICGFKKRSRDTRMTVDQLRVCKEEWDHGLVPHYQKPNPREAQVAISNPRHEANDTYVSLTYTTANTSILGTNFFYTQVGSVALYQTALSGTTTITQNPQTNIGINVNDQLIITLDDASKFTTTVTQVGYLNDQANSPALITLAAGLPSQASAGKLVQVFTPMDH